MYYIFYKYSNVGSSKNIFLFLATLPYFTHRGLSHSLLSVIIIGVTLYPLYETDTMKSYYISALISYSSHLFLGDIFTKKGIKLFYPLSKKDISFNVFKSPKIYNHLDTPFLIIYGMFSIFVFLNFLQNKIPKYYTKIIFVQSPINKSYFNINRYINTYDKFFS